MKFIILAGVLLITCTIKVVAVSAYPGRVEVTQPDGTTITVVQKGDEFLHWYETTDGIRLIQNEQGYFTYATQDRQGNMVASTVNAQNAGMRSATAKSFIAAQPANLFFSSTQLQAAKQRRSAAQQTAKTVAVSTGVTKRLVVLMAFKDVPFTKTRTDFDSLFNKAGYSVNGNQGSVKDYFTANSYGKLTLNFDVFGPYTAKNNRMYYGQDANNTQGNDAHPDSLVMEALRNVHTANPTLDMSQYSGIHVIFAQYGQEWSGVTSDAIWSHEGSITPPPFFSVGEYSCSPELLGNAGSMLTTIGVVCHELTHTLGSPDYYDTDYETNGNYVGTGAWDLMADGNWNRLGTNPYATCPANENMYQKIRFGWVNPVLLDSMQTVNAMPNSEQNPVAYIFTTPTRGERYVLENRQQIGFDQSLPGHGLLIYHVAQNTDGEFYAINITHPQGMYPVCASSTYTTPTKDPTSYGTINSQGCPFPGTSANQSFTDKSTPSAKTWSGQDANKPVTNISESNKTISFDFMDGVEIASSPLDLHGNLIKRQFILSWDKPTYAPLLADTVIEQHLDGAATWGTLWTQQSTTWGCGQIYAASSLASFVGKQWIGVRFFPIDDKATSYKIQLYENHGNTATQPVATASLSNSAVRAGTWNEFMFATPYIIKANCSYAVVVSYTSPQGYTISLDRGPKIKSGGNDGSVVIQNNSFSTLDPSQGMIYDANFNVGGLISTGSPITYNIYRDDVLLGTSSALTFNTKGTISGHYCVVTVNNGVKGDSACIDYVYVPLKAYAPVGSGSVIIEGTESGDIIQIYNVLGQMVISAVSDGSTSLRYQLPAGVWIVKVGAYTKKMSVL